MEAKYKGYKDIEARKEYNRNYQKDYMIKYRAKMKALGITLKWNSQGYLGKLRRKALEKLGELKCEDCGCDIYEILEINHKNGGGHQQRKVQQARKLLYDIIYERVDISEYNILCKICNAKHYVESILRIKGHTVLWKLPL